MALTSAASAANFNINGGDLKSALGAYTAQTGLMLMVSDEAIKGVRSAGVRGDLSNDEALNRILTGTGFTAERHSGGVAIVRRSSAEGEVVNTHVAAASVPTAPGASLETVTVTSSKIGGDVQNIPIAITALSQEQLTQRKQLAAPIS